MDSFLDLLYFNIPRRDESEKMRQRLKGMTLLFALITRLFEVHQLILYLGRVFGVFRPQGGSHSLCGQQLGEDSYLQSKVSL